VKSTKTGEATEAQGKKKAIAEWNEDIHIDTSKYVKRIKPAKSQASPQHRKLFLLHPSAVSNV
jgi:hypothetical protein